MPETNEPAPEPTKREILTSNLKHLRENTPTPSAETLCVLLTGELVLELTAKQPLLPV